MGLPKALLLFAGEPLIVHTIRLLQKFFSDIVVVAAPEQELPPLPVTITRDEVAYQGPVGGMFYGLHAAREELCFVTSCDAPFLNPTLISYLLSLASDYDVVVPHWQDRLQPLHAVYRRSVIPLLGEQLKRGELRPIFLYKKVRTREVTKEEIRRFDPEGLSFRNMNSPEDYQAALALWQQQTEHSERDRDSGQRNQRETEVDEKLALYPPSRSQISVSNLSLTVELFGVARLKAKTDRLVLSLPSGAKLTDALLALAEVCPNLVGTVIAPDHRSFLAGYACNLNGVEFVRTLDTPIRDGDQALILSSDAGG
jgi:molybdopterin-guanine dinucleotide biosynthesis protein A/molybdopterin converting factor small subunit